MTHEIKKLPKSQVEIKLTIPTAEVEKHRKKACEEISRDVKVRGFRPGHIPMHVLESVVEKKYIDAHTQDIAIRQAYVEAVFDEKLEVVARPEIKIESEDPLVVIATVSIMPEVEISNHKSIKIPLEDAKVGEEDLEKVLTDMRKYEITYKQADRAAQKGDRMEIDFEGFHENGEPAENTKSANHPVVIGENTLIPGFEDELIGLKNGDKKEFDIRFPKDYFKTDFQDKVLKFKIEVKNHEEPVIPELTEELIEKVSGQKKGIEEFKQIVRDNLKAQKESEVKRNRETKYIEALLEKTKVDLPEALLHDEIHHIINEVKENVERRGIKFDLFLQQANQTHEDLHKKYAGEAEKRLKTRLALRKLIELEEVKLTDDEIQQEFEKVKSFYPKNEHYKIEKDFKKGDLKNQIANRLTLAKLFEKVLV